MENRAVFFCAETDSTAPLTESFASLFKGCGFSGQSPEPCPAGHGIPLLIFPISREGKSTKTKTKARPAGRAILSRTKCAHGKDRPKGRSFLICKFRLKPGSDTGFQWGISPSADGASGLCPENPRPFEKGRRKLQYGCGAGFRPLQQLIHQSQITRVPIQHTMPTLLQSDL